MTSEQMQTSKLVEGSDWEWKKHCAVYRFPDCHKNIYQVKYKAEESMPITIVIELYSNGTSGDPDKSFEVGIDAVDGLIECLKRVQKFL